MLSPKVSVIVATYNREKYLKEAIISVLEQTYCDFEIIVIDDGSTDNTHIMIESFQDPRLRYIKQENHGRSHARNVGLHLSKGQYIAFLDSDDLYLMHKLALQISYLDTHPKVGMIYTSAYCIDDNGNFISHQYKAKVSGSIYHKIAFFIPVTITLPTVMLRRNIILKAGGFDEKMYRFEDTDLWRRISKITPIDAIDVYTCKLRTHAGNDIKMQNAQQLVNAVHYYVAKILNEDKKTNLLLFNWRIGGLYYYYAHALRRVPDGDVHSHDFLQHAYQYCFLYKIKEYCYECFTNKWI